MSEEGCFLGEQANELTAWVKDLKRQDGYVGNFSRYQSPGALPNKSRIAKQTSEQDDVTPNGTLGTVLGSVRVPNKGLMYTVEWDDKPGVAVFVSELKISEYKGVS